MCRANACARARARRGVASASVDNTIAKCTSIQLERRASDSGRARATQTSVEARHVRARDRMRYVRIIRELLLIRKSFLLKIVL